MGAALSSNQNLIHVSDGFAVNLKNHVHLPLRGRMKKVARGGDFFLRSVIFSRQMEFSLCFFRTKFVLLMVGCGHIHAQQMPEGHPDAEYVPAVNGQLLVNPSYLVDFDGPSGVAHWVHYTLQSSECVGPAVRSNDFHLDRRAPGCPDHQAYRASGYDRGHLKPAADSKRSHQEMRASFLMTNMAPQTPGLNRGVWKKLEEHVRAWSFAHDEVHVTCGPSDYSVGTLPSGVRVPAAFWKVILRTSPDTSCMAFRFPNQSQVSSRLVASLVRVDDLEAELGIDLFPALPDDIEHRIEAHLPKTVWYAPALPDGTGDAGVKKGNSPSSAGTVQCMGMAKSTGRRCRNSTTHPSGRCHHHRN